MNQNTAIKKPVSSCLGLKTVSKTEYDQLNKSIRQFYRLEDDISYYQPNFHLMTQRFPNDLIRTYNHKYRIKRLLRLKRKHGAVGSVFRAQVQHKTPFFTDVFVKEIPVFQIEQVYMFYQDRGGINFTDQRYNQIVYDPHSPANVEILVNYMVSRLVEHNRSPHFCLFYGAIGTMMSKFTYNLSNESKKIDDGTITRLMAMCEDRCRLVKHSKEYHLEWDTLPAYLMMTEKAHIDIEFLYKSKRFDYHYFRSFLFGLFSAVVTMNTVYGIKHNDLHLANLMLTMTDKSAYYYRYKDKTYKVPTFDYCIKIVDFGRSTYLVNNVNGNNRIFDRGQDCFGQYQYPRINGHRKAIVPDENPWTDLVMLSHNLLHHFKDFRDSALGEMLFECIRVNDTECLNIDKFDWDIYREISQHQWSVDPDQLFYHPEFQQFVIDEKSIPDIDIVYLIA